MIKLEHSIVINRPVEEVYDFVTDVEKASQWRSGVVESKKISDEPAVGATASEVMQFLGRRMETTYEITEYEPNRKFGFKVISGPVPMEGVYTFESVGSGTKLDFTVEGEAGGFFRLAEPIVARIARPPTGPDRFQHPEGPA